MLRGTRNAQNFRALEVAGKDEFPVCFSAHGITLEESFNACEYVAARHAASSSASAALKSTSAIRTGTSSTSPPSVEAAHATGLRGPSHRRPRRYRARRLLDIHTDAQA